MTERGFSLVEVMIGLTLGLFASLAMVQSFSGSETMRQAATGRADAFQSGSLAHWRLSRQFRMAGGGLGHAPAMIGCAIQASRNGAPVLPRAGAWPAPFRAFPAQLRLTPVAVLNDRGPAGSDLLLSMGGMPAASVVPSPVSAATATSIQASGTIGFAAGDLLLVGDAGAAANCLIGQIDQTFVPAVGALPAVSLPTSQNGAPFNSAAGFGALPQPGDFQALNLGPNPMLQLVGINQRGQLVVLDPLQIYTAQQPIPLIGNVVQFQVVFGVDNGGAGGVRNDNIIDQWLAPIGRYGYANMVAAGSDAALEVKAMRVAIVVRSQTPTTSEAPSQITLFEDLPAGQRKTLSLPAEARKFGYQVLDTVVPLRNQSAALCAEFRRQTGIPFAGTCS